MDSDVADLLVTDQDDAHKTTAAVEDHLPQKENPSSDVKTLVEQVEMSEPQPPSQDVVQENALSESPKQELRTPIESTPPSIVVTPTETAPNTLEGKAEETAEPHVRDNQDNTQQKEANEVDTTPKDLPTNSSQKNTDSDQSSAAQGTKKKRSVGKRITDTLAAMGFKRKSSKKDPKSLKESESSKTSLTKSEKDSPPPEQDNCLLGETNSDHSLDTALSPHWQTEDPAVKTVINLEEHMNINNVGKKKKNIQALQISAIDKNSTKVFSSSINESAVAAVALTSPKSIIPVDEQKQPAREIKDPMLEINKASGEIFGCMPIVNISNVTEIKPQSKQPTDYDTDNAISAEQHVDTGNSVEVSSSNEQYIQDDHCFDSQKASASILPQQQIQKSLDD